MCISLKKKKKTFDKISKTNFKKNYFRFSNLEPILKINHKTNDKMIKWLSNGIQLNTIIKMSNKHI